MSRVFALDSFAECIYRYERGYAVVVVDVIRATTTAITALNAGRRCFITDSLESAWHLAWLHPNALVMGEQDGVMPAGFHMNNSPSELAKRRDVFRPVVLLSSAGSRLMHSAASCEAAYAACFRNYSATAAHLIRSGYPAIALIGAGTRGEIREEDVICCALIANQLRDAGYQPEDDHTMDMLRRWAGAKPDDCLISKSVSYLRSSGQLADLDFTLSHIDDLDAAAAIENGEVFAIGELECPAVPIAS